MRNSTKAEIRMLREVAHFLLPLLYCEFCGKPLLDPKLADKVFGEKAHTPLKKLKLTVHHRNGKHRDNRRNSTLQLKHLDSYLHEQFAICGNTSLVHTTCHKQHEMKLTHKGGNLKSKSMREKAKILIKRIDGKNENDATRAAHVMSGSECSFVVRLKKRLKDKTKKQFTRYEIRRLKKLAAKVEGVK